MLPTVTFTGRSTLPLHRIKPTLKAGYIVIAVFASLSAFALSFIALRGLWLVVSPIFTRNSKGGIVSKEKIFFRTQLGYYAVCLLVSNVFTSAAGVVASFWVAMDGIGREEEWLCIFQAILMQIGNFSTAYFTVAVAVHTINSFVFRLQQTALVGAIVMAMGWVSSLIIGVAPLKISSPDFGLAYGFDGFSCGIKYTFPVPHFLLHLLPIFIAAAASVIIYSLIFLALRGTLVVKGGVKIILDPKQRCALDRYHCFIGTIAKSMLWFPFAYTILLLPYSITKLLVLSGYPVAFEGNVFAYTCSFILGLVNVCLLYNTFRVLEPAFGVHCAASSVQKSDIECCGAPLETTKHFPAVVVTTLEKPTTARAYGESFLPSWHFSIRDDMVSTWTCTSTYQNSISSPGADSPVDYLIPDNYEGHCGSSNLSLAATESITRPAIPTSDFKNVLIAVPEPVLQKQNANLANTRLHLNHSPSSSAYHARPSPGLPPPRQRRSLVCHQNGNEIEILQPVDEEQWSDAIRRGSVLSPGASMMSGTSGEHGCSGFSHLPSPSRWLSQFTSIERSSLSELRTALDALVSNVAPVPTPSATMPSPTHYYDDNDTLSVPPTAVTISPCFRGLPEVPRNVDSNDFGSVPVSARRTSDIVREEFYSSVGAITLGGLSPFAWATLVVPDAVTSESSSPARKSALSDENVFPVSGIIQPVAAHVS